MTQNQLEKFIVYFTSIYTALFSINALLRGNVEFIYYTAMMIMSIAVILIINKRMHFYPIVLMSLSVVGLLHLLGGNIIINGERLYDIYFIPNIFRYDNFVHTLGSGVMVMLAHALLTPVLNKDFEKRRAYFVLLLVLVGMGLGAINELVEFGAVLIFNVGQQVGDYTNTLLDLTFNTIGSAIMASFLVLTKKKLTQL
jgi:hypothetical protein